MKHTEVYNLHMALRTIALQELEQAVAMQDNQEFEWCGNDGPSVVCYDYCVTSVTINKVYLQGGLHITGYDWDNYTEVEIDEFSLTPMDILLIVDQLPGDEDVSLSGMQEKIDELTNYLKSL